MIAHIMQALIVIILIAFPFAINFNGISLDNHSLNSTAVVDSAIVKHYAQNGSLPEKLDAETLKKLGLDADDIKGMTYKKLEDRKFVLSYADSKDKVNESIHSNTQLPVNVNTNFGQVESKEDTFWLELPESPNQTVTVEIKFPDGSTAVLNEGEKKQYPANSEFNVVVVPDKGFGPGKGLPSNGLLNKDMVLEVTKAELNKIKITINKPNPIPPEGEEALYYFHNIQANTPRWSWGSEAKFIPLGIGETYVPFGSEIRGGVLLPETGKPQIYQVEAKPINFIAENDTVINLEITKRLGYIVNVDNTPNQTIKVTVDTTKPLPWKDLYRKGEVPNQFQIWNGESCIVPRLCEIVKVEVVADAGYKPGTPSVTACEITGDITVTASEAVKEEITPSSQNAWQYCFDPFQNNIKPVFGPFQNVTEGIAGTHAFRTNTATFKTSSKERDKYLRVHFIGMLIDGTEAYWRLVLKNKATGQTFETYPDFMNRYEPLDFLSGNQFFTLLVVKCQGDTEYLMDLTCGSQRSFAWYTIMIEEFYSDEVRIEGDRAFGDRLTNLGALPIQWLPYRGEI